VESLFCGAQYPIDLLSGTKIFEKMNQKGTYGNFLFISAFCIVDFFVNVWYNIEKEQLSGRK
jgi:hypothetical protein